MYQVIYITEQISGETVEHVYLDLPGGGVQTFANAEWNSGPERSAYLQWLAEGNEPEIFKPEPTE